MMLDTGAVIGEALSTVVAPGSGATVTVAQFLVPISEIGQFFYLALVSSHDSAANGVTCEASWDGGVTWRVIATDQYLAADGFTLFQAPLVAPLQRWRYANSANVLTTWAGGAFRSMVDLVRV